MTGPLPATGLLPGAPALSWQALAACITACAAIGLATVPLADRFGAAAPAGAIVAAAGLMLALSSSAVALALLLAAVAALERQDLFQLSLPLLGGGLKPLDIALVVILGGMTVRRALAPARPIAWTEPLPLAVIAMVGWSAVAAGHGLAVGIPYRESLAELRPLLQYLLFFAIIAELEARSIRRLIYLVIAVSTVMAVRAAWLFAHGVGAVDAYAGGHVRVMDFEFSFLVFSALLLLALIAGGARHRLLLAGLLAVCLAGLVATLYRSGFLGLGFGVAALYVLMAPPGRRRLRQGGLAIVLALAVLLPAVALVRPALLDPIWALRTRMLSVAAYDKDPSAQHRLHEWSAAAQLIRQSPVVGHGLGSRIRFFSPMYDEVNNRWGFWSNDFYTHNSYVWIAAKMGAIGLAATLAVIVLFFRRILRAHRPPGHDALVAGIGACFASLLLMSFFGPLLNAPNVTPFAAFLLGAGYVLTRPAAGTQGAGAAGLPGEAP